MKRTIRLVFLIVLLGAAVAGWFYVRARPGLLDQARATLGLAAQPAALAALEASGTIEAQTVSVSAEVGGRVASLSAEEGDEVERGQALVQLDTALLDAEIKKAQAGLRVAQAGAELARAGARPEAVAQAEAVSRQLLVAVENARRGWNDAQAVRAAPQEIDVQIAAARSQVALTAGQVRLAKLATRAADLELAMYNRLLDALRGGVQVEIPSPNGPRVVTVPVVPEKMAQAAAQANLAGQRTWQTYAALEEAEAAHAAALRTLDSLLKERSQPLALDAQVHAAEAAYREAEAAVPAAQAIVADLKAGARPEEIAVADAGAGEAESALRTLQAQRAKMTLSAPQAGLVIERNVGLGETVGPGATLCKIASLDRVTLTIYIPEGRIGRVKVGQTVRVSVDSFPDRSFAGVVTHIATQAEFTPKNVQTKEERASMVFAVKVEIANAGHELKPGMPADAVVESEGG